MQQDFEITAADANTGTTVRAAINAALQALASCSSGATEPTTMYAYQWWADTTTGFLKQRNAANTAWITIINLATPGLAITAGKTITVTQDTSLDEAVAMSSKAPKASPTFTGTVTIPTTASSATGVIYKGADRFIHNFEHPTGDTAVPVGYNTFVGVNAGNFAMGSTATQTHHGSYNSAMGYAALYSNTTGYQNSAMGLQALDSNTTGYQNSAMGMHALYSNTTGCYNSAMGMYALYSNTTGCYNSAMGMRALQNNTTGCYNSAMGYAALYSVKPTSKTITAFADYGGTVAGTVKATSTAHGLPSGTTADIAISGTTNYNGVYTVTYIDVDNFYFTKAWVSNDATGWWSRDTEGRYNIGIGYQAGDNITTGSNNLIIGYNVDAPSATADNQLNIGNVIYGSLSTGNVGIGTAAFGTSAVKVLGIGTGTAPTTAPADMVQIYSADIAAGHAAPHFMTELGEVVKLYQQAHIADATDAATAITRINAILVALENTGLLATA